MDRIKYPDGWPEIFIAIKEEADWQCECCGKQCRRPGEPFDTHRRTLTVARCNHIYSDYRPENLAAMCAPCYLKYAAKTRYIGYAIDRAPGPALYVYPDEQTARDNSRDCIRPMIETSARLRDQKIL